MCHLNNNSNNNRLMCIWRFPKMEVPQMDDLWWKILPKLMIWRYPPYLLETSISGQMLLQTSKHAWEIDGNRRTAQKGTGTWTLNSSNFGKRNKEPLKCVCVALELKGEPDLLASQPTWRCTQNAKQNQITQPYSTLNWMWNHMCHGQIV